MPQIVIDNPVAACLVVALLVLFVWRGGAILNLRRDSRSAKRDEVDLLATIREITSDQMRDLREDQAAMREKLGELEHEFDKSNAVVRSAVSYIHTLLAYISVHLPARTDVPPAPSLLDDYILTNVVPKKVATTSSIEMKGPADVRIDVHHS